MQELFREAETLADHIRTAVRTFYGVNSEKLVEFGLKPKGARVRRTKPPVVPKGPEAPAPAETSAVPIDKQ